MEQEAEWARRSPAPIRRAASGRPPRWSISQPIWPSSETASSSSISIPKATPRAASGSTAATLDGSIYDALVADAPLAELHVATPVEGLGSSRRRSPWPARRWSWRASTGASGDSPGALEAERDAWDWILIDCPPSLGLLTVNALTGADAVLVPIQCEFYALEGLTQLIATINLVRDHLNPDLAIAGVVLTMFDGRTNLSTEVAAEVRRHLHERGLPDGRPAERPPVRGPEPRPADRALPARVEGRRGVSRARRRVPRARPQRAASRGPARNGVERKQTPTAAVAGIGA